MNYNAHVATAYVSYIICQHKCDRTCERTLISQLSHENTLDSNSQTHFQESNKDDNNHF